MAAFLEEIDTSVTGMVASTSIAASSPWKISVWFYHLRYSDGSTDQQNFDAEQFVGDINTYFAGTFEFIVCGSTNIDNNDFVQLDIGNNSNDLTNLWAAVDTLDEPLADNCVRVFLTGSGDAIYKNGVPDASGYTHDPLRYAKPAVFLSYLAGRLWAHEFGHYFGLPHTFEGMGLGQYVHDLGTPVTIGGISYTCYQTGDGFCDTPADPNNCSFSSQCQTPSCTPSLDPLGVLYNPDPTLLMGYNGANCRNRFSGEQHQRMRTLYLDHPAYVFLHNLPLECILPEYGKIERNCENYDPPIQKPIQYLVSLPVEVRDEYQSCNSQYNKTDTAGRYLIAPCTLTGIRRTILPDRKFGNDPLSGVTTFDLLLINKNILGSVEFENPFQIIAADANISGSITTFDIVELRKLILGIYQELPHHISWRYVPMFFTSDLPVTDTFFINPFQAKFPDPFQNIQRSYNSPTKGVTVPNSDGWMDFVSLIPASGLVSSIDDWSFTGVKVGDVNCTADIDISSIEQDDHEFLIDSSSVASTTFSGVKRVEIIASSSSDILAWQFGVRYTSDSLLLSDLAAGTDEEAFDEENFHIAPADSLQPDGMFRAIWYAADGQPASIDGKVLFGFEARAIAGMVPFEDQFRLDNSVLSFEFYDEDGEVVDEVTLTLRISDIPQEYSAPAGGANNTVRASKPLRVKAYPTPFTNEVEFVFDLPFDEEEVRLEIFDARGSLVFSRQDALPSGLQVLNVNSLAWQPSGFYWYVLYAGEFAAQGKLSKR